MGDLLIKEKHLPDHFILSRRCLNVGCMFANGCLQSLMENRFLSVEVEKKKVKYRFHNSIEVLQGS